MSIAYYVKTKCLLIQGGHASVSDLLPNIRNILGNSAETATPPINPERARYHSLYLARARTPRPNSQTSIAIDELREMTNPLQQRNLLINDTLLKIELSQSASSA